MPLSASVREYQREWRRRKVADLRARGLCVRCKKPNTRTTDRCARCTAVTVDDNWRAYQRGLTDKPVPPKTDVAWNFETDDLILDHVAMAKRVAWAVSTNVPATDADVEDMVGDAMYGLVVAGRMFDPSRQVPFDAWAFKWVRGAVYTGFRRWTHGRMQQRPVMMELREDDGGDWE